VIDIGFDPYLSLGPLRASWHGIFGLLAVLAGAGVGIRLLVPRVTFDDAQAVALGGIVAGLVGSRLFHVLDRAALYAAEPLRVLAVWDGGESIVGGIVGGLVGGLAVMLRRGLPVGAVFDRAICGLPLGMAIGRIGDVINGEHWARACEGLPWCVRYTHPASPGQREFVHPAVAYELLADLVIFGALLALLARRRAPEGRLPFVFLGAYGAVRLILSALRLDPIWIIGLTQAQIVSALFVVVSLAGLWWLRTYPQPTSPAGGRD
jgi:phosphatidylglycerol:prolipoprotein diacylglycerol transferase